MSRLWLWSWLCLCVCSLAEDSCSASPRPVSGNCLLQKKGVVKKVAPAHEVLELKKRDDDDDEDGGDDDEEDVPLFDNGPGRSGNGKPLHKCQGSCSDDADCEGDLVCVTPKFVGWDGFVPGCRSGPRGKPLWEFRYCSEKPPDGWRTATTSTTTPEPTPPPPPAPSVITDCPAGGVCARLMAFNVYYAALGREDRMDGIAQAIADVTPDIAVITEQWKEKPTILEKIKQKTNKYYAFCLGGPQEKWWDGDILYRADLFEVVKDSIMDWGANRGLSWAVLKHKDSGKKVIIYGAHPVCCGNEPIHLQNALDFAEHAKTLVDLGIAFSASFGRKLFDMRAPPFRAELSTWLIRVHPRQLTESHTERQEACKTRQTQRLLEIDRRYSSLITTRHAKCRHNKGSLEFKAAFGEPEGSHRDSFPQQVGMIRGGEGGHDPLLEKRAAVPEHRIWGACGLVTDRFIDGLALAAALLGVASASILLVFAERELTPYAAAFNRLGFATIIFLAWNIGQSFLYQLGASGADVALFFTAGLAFSSSLSIWAWSLTQTSVANSTLLHNMMPIFTTLGAWLCFRQTCSRKFLLGMAVAMAGATVIGMEDFQVNRGHLGDAAALLAALLSSVNILVVKQLRHHFEAPTIMMCTCGIGSTFLFILLQVLEDQVFPRTSVAWCAVLCLALFPQALGQGLLAYSLKQFSASLVAVSMLTVPVIAAILARFLFAEQLTLLNWAAFGVVLLGIYLAVSDS
ncbi:unnamed protein product [Symbiodinium microadriaticum]|nr:unnamed protein product [Symbiodinium microadriaticum]